VFVTRRCEKRRFLLRPDSYVTQVFLYCLAYAAAEFDILIHAIVALDNHYHLLLTDPHGYLPLFMERFDGLLARALNAYWGRWESFFAPGSYSTVQLDTPEDRLAKLVYILVNPVAAGLVEHARRWTGATSVRWKFGETRTFTRPDGAFFGPSSKLPEKVSLTLAPLPGFEDRTPAQLDDLVRERVIARETELRAQHRSEGKSYLGMDAVLRCDPEDRPRTREPRRRINPRVAGRQTDVRVEAIARWTSFTRMYRQAWLQWRDGDHTAVFPEGTWLMRVRHGAACLPATTSSAHPPPPS
jgi:REP element-mobilizing transposase RayT